MATVQVPFQTGGATLLSNHLGDALRRAGHTVSVITAPFRFGPDAELSRSMDFWQTEDFRQINYIEPEVVIPLSFPCWGLTHPNKRVWMLHQHRAAYELYDEKNMTQMMSEQIRSFDTNHLNTCQQVFTISARVTERLATNNAIKSTPILHPPPDADLLYRSDRDALPFIFFPSRIETLKRQTLAISAMQYVDKSTFLIIAGMGGQYGACRDLVKKLGLENQVRLLGEISEADKRALYATSSAVLFPPFDEDYGYVTLEAMCAAKPVITCHDSGGVLDFVVDGVTGHVVAPTARAIADAINSVANNKKKSVDMGEAGLSRYQQLDLSWNKVVSTLMGPA